MLDVFYYCVIYVFIGLITSLIVVKDDSDIEQLAGAALLWPLFWVKAIAQGLWWAINGAVLTLWGSLWAGWKLLRGR